MLISRRGILKSAEGDEGLISGSGTFAAVNLLLVISTVFIFIGTALPVFTSVATSTSYFNITNLPVFLAVILLAGICALVGWKTPDIKKLNKKLLWSALAGTRRGCTCYRRIDRVVCAGGFLHTGGCLCCYSYQVGQRCGGPYARQKKKDFCLLSAGCSWPTAAVTAGTLSISLLCYDAGHNRVVGV
jgi:hypothetical protein